MLMVKNIGRRGCGSKTRRCGSNRRGGENNNDNKNSEKPTRQRRRRRGSVPKDRDDKYSIARFIM